MTNNWFKNYGVYQLSQSKRLIVNKNSTIHNIHLCCNIEDVEQTISIPNMASSYVYQEIGAGNWGDSVAVELNIILYPIPENKKITNKIEYRMMINVNVFSTKNQNEKTPEDKQQVRKVFNSLAESAETEIHIHPMDYYVLESDD